MALVEYSSIINKLSGKLGGSIFSSNRCGACVRATSHVRNKLTTNKSYVQQDLRNVVLAWRILPLQNKLHFQSQAALLPQINRFGKIYYWSGYTLFMSLNLKLLSINKVMNTEGDVSELLDPMMHGYFELSVAAINFVFTIDRFQPEWSLVIDATRVKSQGSLSIPSADYYKISVLDSAQVFPADLISDYQEVFSQSDFEGGTVIYFRYRMIHNETGMSSNYLYSRSQFVP